MIFSLLSVVYAFCGLLGCSRTLCSNGFADLLSRSTCVGERLLDRGLEGLAGALQTLGDVLLRRFEVGHAIRKMLFGGIALGADGAFGGLSDRLGLLRKSLEIGLRGSAALRCGIADCSVQFLCGSSNVVERVFDIRLYFSHDGFSSCVGVIAT